MEIGELVAVGIDSVLKHGPDCPFCKTNAEEKPPKTPVSKMENDLDEDPDAGLVDNDSGELDKEMDKGGLPRPKDWLIDTAKIGHTEAKHQVIANPHHLVPGNESLKQSTELLPWIFESKGKIKNDIGYNVNNAANGIWLPSNNGMRGQSRWSNKKFKLKYVVLAMDKAGGHFHDRHGNPYSSSVTKILNTIANRMNGIDAVADCPYKTEKDNKDGKFKPPYALVARLNGVSTRLRGYLLAGSTPQGSFYTSKLVLYYWVEKGAATDEAGVLG
jgi:hypothetical protein